MSLVNEYLRKTQEGAPSTLEGGAVPPVLTRNKPGNDHRNLLRFVMLLGVVVVAVVVVIKFYPYFSTFMKADTAAKSTEVAIKSGSTEAPQSKPAAPPSGPPETAVKAGQASPAVKSETRTTTTSAPPEAKPQETAPQQTSQAVGPGPATETTAQELLKVPSLSDNTSVMTSAPQAPREEKIKIVATDSTGKQSGQEKTESQASAGIPPFPADESFLSGYEGDYAPSAVVVTSKRVGTGAQSGQKRANRSTRNLKSEQLFQLGLSAQKSGQFDEAEEYYIEGLKRDPSNVGMMANLSAAYLEQHKYKEAESVLNKARKLSPSNSKILVNLGLLELGRNQTGKAKHWFSEAARLNPYDLDALNNLAYLAQQENDLAGMETYYQRMVSLSPNNSDILLTYASLLERNNKFQQAIAIYQKALDMPAIKGSASMKGEIRKRIRILSQY